MIGWYLPGTSVVHRSPAGVKLAILLVAGVALSVWRTAPMVAVVGVLVLAAYTVARIPPLVAARQIWPLRWFVPIIVAVQLLSGSVSRAAVLPLALIVLVAGAGLVTLTTPVERILSVITTILAPLRRFGVNDERIALLFALTIRAIPVVSSLASDVRDARIARGAGRSMRALAVPLVIRTVRHADHLGEALAARGADD